MSTKTDKQLEFERYEGRARRALAASPAFAAGDEFARLPAALRAPYEAYREEIDALTGAAGARVLELGAGSGRFTEFMLQAGAELTASDISASALELLRQRLARYENLWTSVADMEALPFADGEFDLVTSAGSLSYGDNETVMNEIYRVLAPGGKFVCVDSLNHNPVYRLNRWLQYLRGQRSRSTLERMPTLGLVKRYGEKFGRVRARYYGSISWAVPLLRRLLGERRAARISGAVDRAVGVSRSAFKLVMVAEKIE